MVRRHDEEQLVGDPRSHARVLSPQDVTTDHAEIDSIRADTLLDHARVGNLEGDIDAGITLPDGERAAHEPLQLVERAPRGRQCRRDSRRVAVENMPGLRQRDGAGGAIEGPHTQLGLELADLLRQRRLAQAELLGAAREALGMRHGEKHFER